MSEPETPDFDERCPIWARYTNEVTDRKREQIERVLTSAGARFGVHVVRVGIGAPSRQHAEPLPQRLPDALRLSAPLIGMKMTMASGLRRVYQRKTSSGP